MNARVNVIYWLSEVPSTSIRHFFFFFFALQLHVRKKKKITEIRWFRYSCERIESQFIFTNTITSQHIISSGITMFHCHLAFLRIAVKRQQKRSSIFSFTRDLSYIASFISERKFYARTHVKITRQWTSNLI